MKDQIGLHFASALRAFLRQDRDIILVGEIRDLETAEFAVKATLTGHQLPSTLHSNDAPSTNAPRRVRRICSNCKEPPELPEQSPDRCGLWFR